MADVALQGQLLIEEIDTTEPQDGRLAFWWMGQNSFVYKGGGKIIYIDPYLAPSSSRQTPPLLEPSQITHADLVLCTHDHGDHIDPRAIPGIAEAAPNARFVVPRPARERMLSLGVSEERLTLLGNDESCDWEGVQVHGIKACHEFFDEDPVLGFPYMSYVVQLNGVTFYYAGDNMVYEGLLTALSNWEFDALFLPINGRDARRFRGNCLGNMTFQEAVDLAGSLKPGLAVPMHYDMFAGNSEDPAEFVDYLEAKYPGIPSWVGPAGQKNWMGK